MEFYDLLIILGATALISIKSFIVWKNYYISILEDRFIIEKGVLYKKTKFTMIKFIQWTLRRIFYVEFLML